jgi:4-aminobutyrate aminotransferase-like enzyme
MKMINSFEATSGALALPRDLKDRIARRARLLGPAYRLFYREPLHIVRGAGVWLYDAAGREYLDAYNNVPVVGHCHPEVVAALSDQAAVLNTHTRYLHDAVLDYADHLLGHFPAALSHVMFTCTGSESNDLALRIAKHFTGGSGFVVSSFAYHGGTDAVASLSPSLGYGTFPPAHIRVVPPPDAYRSSGDVGRGFAAAVELAIDDLAKHGHRVAGLLVDTVFSSDGIFTHPTNILTAAAAAIRAAGGLFIADEVQAGFARTGEQFWGFQRYGLVPDMVSLGKPMGNGHPIAGLVVRPEILAEFAAVSRYFNTFGGNAVSAAVAHAVLQVIERERLQERASRMGAYLVGGLQKLAARYPWIGDIRGSGLYVGVELVDDLAQKTPAPDIAASVVNGLRDRGVLISACGPLANVLKIRPPLIFEAQHVDLLLGALEATLSSL